MASYWPTTSFGLPCTKLLSWPSRPGPLEFRASVRILRSVLFPGLRSVHPSKAQTGINSYCTTSVKHGCPNAIIASTRAWLNVNVNFALKREEHRHWPQPAEFQRNRCDPYLNSIASSPTSYFSHCATLPLMQPILVHLPRY